MALPPLSKWLRTFLAITTGVRSARVPRRANKNEVAAPISSLALQMQVCTAPIFLSALSMKTVLFLMELIVLDHCKFCQLIDLGTEDIQVAVVTKVRPRV